MEISGAAVLRRSPMFAAAGGGFSDEGHIRYYVQPVRCGGAKKKEEKMRAKLVKDLSKDLSKFYSIGAAAADNKGKMMSEAADLLLSQLSQLKAEEKELKRKRKEQKAAMKQAKKEAKMVGCNSEDGSSSSSESSCSECESVEPQTNVTAVPVATESCNAAASNVTAVPAATEENNSVAALTTPMTNGVDEPIIPEGRYSNAVAEMIEVFTGHQTPTERYSNAVSEKIEVFMGGKCVVEPIPTDKYSNTVAEIEVCMGGKCKKSGAVELMAEFQKMVGVEGAVVGCKCMGKCKDGPNVRVKNGNRVSGNPLCIGVGLEDVGSIVASLLGEEEGGGVLGSLN